jgi:glucan-binding YG repeat protein
VVDENNPNFSAYDGALYTKDYSELLHVPTERKTISLHENLDTIAEKAIAHCHLSYLILPWGTQTVEELSLNILNRTEDDYAKIYIIVPDTLKNWNGYSTTSMGYERFIFSDHNLFIPQKLYSAYNSSKVESESIPAFLKSLGYNSIYDFYGITPNSFKTFGSKTYYFDANCKMVTGTKTIGDIDYTFDENGVLQSQTAATVKNGLIYQDGKAYYYENGVMLKSRWVYAEGNWYYLNDYGAGVVNCWRLSGGKYFYLGSDGKMQKNRWLKDYGSWYYLKVDGSRYESSWAKINGVWYWFGGSGKMAQSQWLKLNGKWYYFTDSGAMAANKWVKSGAYWYYLGSDGAMLTNTTTPDGYKVDAQGRWK